MTIQQYDHEPPRWYEIGTNFMGFLGFVIIMAAVVLFTWAYTADKYRAAERATMRRQQESTATTLDLCAVRLPMMAGRMVKTEGEVMFWRRGEDGGLDVYLTRELANLRELCAMPVHLPPTVPETTWIPVSGEKVAVCGLMVRNNAQARMSPGWRCL